MARLNVAVIGAGGAGLAMCRYLLNEPRVEFVAFEKACSIGGVWRYTKDSREAINKHNSTPMYKNLRTNLPKEVMAYPDLPFPQELPSFVTRADVSKYLEMYTEHFDLRKYIKFDHQVLSVRPVPRSNEKQTWDVVVKDLKNEVVHKILFDAVIVCNGHFSVPRCPDIPGLDTFPGTVLHSTDYNQPEDFRDQEVIVLGAGSSGLDISIDLSNFSKKIYLVHYGNKIPTKLPGNVQEIIGTLTACSDDTVEINRKELLRNVNAVILCTGYHYSFPFLEPECEIKVENNRVTSLYKHIFSTKFPTLSFIGLCQRICPFINFSAQAQLVASVLSGRTTLPSPEEMVKDEEIDYQERLKQGVPRNMIHLLGAERQFQYCTMLAEMAGIPSVLTPTIQSLHCYTTKIRKTNLTSYRDMNFTIREDEWHEIKSNIS